MGSFFAFVWLVVIGTEGAQYYSESFPFQGALILAGCIVFSIVYRHAAARILSDRDFFFALLLLSSPLLLMQIDTSHVFQRDDFTNQGATAMVIFVAALLSSRPEFDRAISTATFSIVAIATGLNLFELLVQNNVWSTAPGRSAGFYINPNLSGAVIVGYGLLFFMRSRSRIKPIDGVLLILVLVGVFSTFSRSSIIGAILLITLGTLYRIGFKRRFRGTIGILLVGSVCFAALFNYVASNLTLSKDASDRISSLEKKGGVGDYAEERGGAALKGLELAQQNLLLGNGVKTVYRMPEGPHNLFVAVLVDHGLVGLAAFLLVLMRLGMRAYAADRQYSGVLWAVLGWWVLFAFSNHNLLDNGPTVMLLGIGFGISSRSLPEPEEDEYRGVAI